MDETIPDEYDQKVQFHFKKYNNILKIKKAVPPFKNVENLIPVDTYYPIPNKMRPIPIHVLGQFDGKI
jgi:hypothetical protein